MSQYMLLLYDDPAHWMNVGPEEMQKIIQKYVAWRQKLTDQKLLVGSHKLMDEPGKVLRGKSQVRITDGPYSETKEVLGGYFLIEAPDYAAACEQARSCPSLEYGGTIEVREVDPMVPRK